MRTAPSAGALYPLDIYLFAGSVTDLPAGVYYYNSPAHELWLLTEGDQRQKPYEAATQPWVKEAPARAGLLGHLRAHDEEASRARPGALCLHGPRAFRGECLPAVGALGLATVALGAFSDAEVRFATGMTRTEEPLYIMPIGRALRTK